MKSSSFSSKSVAQVKKKIQRKKCIDINAPRGIIGVSLTPRVSCGANVYTIACLIQATRSRSTCFELNTDSSQKMPIRHLSNDLFTKSEKSSIAYAGRALTKVFITAADGIIISLIIVIIVVIIIVIVTVMIIVIIIGGCSPERCRKAKTKHEAAGRLYRRRYEVLWSAVDRR